MPQIAILEGWDAFPRNKRSNKMAKRKGGKKKFAKVAKICNKKKGKQARKKCWRSHYR